MIRIIQNPLFRICGIALILYYGLFQNKHDPDSLNNRLSPNNIKSNISEISEKSATILYNVQKAEEIKKSQLEQQKNKNDEQKQ